MADSDQVTLHYVFEQARGVTPATPAFRALRVTVPGVTLDPRLIESQELNATRQTTDQIQVATDVGGELAMELSYGNADDWIEAAFCGTWGVKAKLTATAISTTAITVASGGTAVKKGMVLRGSGHAAAGNNGLFYIGANATGTSITITGGTTDAAPAAGSYFKCVGFQGASGDMQAVSDGITITSTSGDFTTLLLRVGEWIKVGGTGATFSFATANSNGWARISAISATKLTFDRLPSGWTTDSGSAKTVRLSFGDVLDHGTTRRSATIQRRFNDLSPVVYETTRGQESNTLRFEFRPQDIARMTCGLMGDSGAIATAQIAGATDTAAPTYDVMGTGSDIGRVAVDGTEVGISDQNYIQSLSFTLDNQMRNRSALGRNGYVGRALGRLRVEGQVDIYFADSTLAQKAISNTDVGLDWRIADDAGRTMLFDIPAAKLSGTITVPGTNQDAMLPLRLQARRHPTLLYTIRLQRFDELL